MKPASFMPIQHLTKPILRISMLSLKFGVLFLCTSQNLMWRTLFFFIIWIQYWLFYLCIHWMIIFVHLEPDYPVALYLAFFRISIGFAACMLLFTCLSFPHTLLCLVSVCPTFGGTNPGLRAELIHSVNEDLSLICGCAYTIHPSAFASISVSCFWTGRDFWFSHCLLSYS